MNLLSCGRMALRRMASGIVVALKPKDRSNFLNALPASASWLPGGGTARYAFRAHSGVLDHHASIWGADAPSWQRLEGAIFATAGLRLGCSVGTPRGLSLNLVAPYLEAPPGTRNGGR